MVLREPKRICTFDELSKRTIHTARNLKSENGKIKLLHISFADGDYCMIASDNPSVNIHLVGDDERVIPEV